MSKTKVFFVSWRNSAFATSWSERCNRVKQKSIPAGIHAYPNFKFSVTQIDVIMVFVHLMKYSTFGKLTYTTSGMGQLPQREKASKRLEFSPAKSGIIRTTSQQAERRLLNFSHATKVKFSCLEVLPKQQSAITFSAISISASKRLLNLAGLFCLDWVYVSKQEGQPANDCNDQYVVLFYQRLK